MENFSSPPTHGHAFLSLAAARDAQSLRPPPQDRAGGMNLRVTADASRLRLLTLNAEHSSLNLRTRLLPSLCAQRNHQTASFTYAPSTFTTRHLTL